MFNNYMNICSQSATVTPSLILTERSPYLVIGTLTGSMLLTELRSTERCFATSAANLPIVSTI